jgi:nuclear transport factor 2 (NTF2) superfamily protein
LHPTEPEEMPPLELRVCIVSWNARDDLRACLASLPDAVFDYRFETGCGRQRLRRTAAPTWSRASFPAFV